MESYTKNMAGWCTLCIPAAIISVILLRGGKAWYFWLGACLFVVYAAFGFWVDFA